MIFSRKQIVVIDKLLGVTSSFAMPLFLLLVFVFMLLLDTVLTRPFLLSICEGKMAQLGRLSNIRAIYTKKSKPRIAQTAAYIRRELDHLYECGLYKMQSAGIQLFR